LNAANLIEIGHSGTGMFDLNGGTIVANEFRLGNGTFDFKGGELYVETFTGDLVNDGGTICPGSSPGITTVEGNVLLNSGSLEIELAGLLRGDQYDAFVVTGTLTPGGTLQVRLLDAFTPELGDTFDILDWGALAGSEFDTVDVPVLSGGLDWDVSKLYDTGEIYVTPEPTTFMLLTLGGLTLIQKRKK